MQTTRKVANAIFAFFVTEYEYKTCIVCGKEHHVLTMRKIGDSWVCSKCNETSGMLYARYACAARMLNQVRM
jgi:ribosomal protein L37AE/L43A